jgi:hypothetical protein
MSDQERLRRFVSVLQRQNLTRRNDAAKRGDPAKPTTQLTNKEKINKFLEESRKREAARTRIAALSGVAAPSARSVALSGVAAPSARIAAPSGVAAPSARIAALSGVAAPSARSVAPSGVAAPSARSVAPKLSADQVRELLQKNRAEIARTVAIRSAPTEISSTRSAAPVGSSALLSPSPQDPISLSSLTKSPKDILKKGPEPDYLLIREMTTEQLLYDCFGKGVEEIRNHFIKEKSQEEKEKSVGVIDLIIKIFTEGNTTSRKTLDELSNHSHWIFQHEPIVCLKELMKRRLTSDQLKQIKVFMNSLSILRDDWKKQLEFEKLAFSRPLNPKYEDDIIKRECAEYELNKSKKSWFSSSSAEKATRCFTQRKKIRGMFPVETKKYLKKAADDCAKLAWEKWKDPSVVLSHKKNIMECLQTRDPLQEIERTVDFLQKTIDELCLMSKKLKDWSDSGKGEYRLESFICNETLKTILRALFDFVDRNKFDGWFVVEKALNQDIVLKYSVYHSAFIEKLEYLRELRNSNLSLEKVVKKEVNGIIMDLIKFFTENRIEVPERTKVITVTSIPIDDPVVSLPKPPNADPDVLDLKARLQALMNDPAYLAPRVDPGMASLEARLAALKADPGGTPSAAAPSADPYLPIGRVASDVPLNYEFEEPDPTKTWGNVGPNVLPIQTPPHDPKIPPPLPPPPARIPDYIIESQKPPPLPNIPDDAICRVRFEELNELATKMGKSLPFVQGYFFGCRSKKVNVSRQLEL